MSNSYSDNSESKESSIPALIYDLDHLCESSSDEIDEQNDDEPVDRDDRDEPVDRHDRDEQQEVCLFASKSYQEAIVRLSERIVQDHCEVREEKRDILCVTFNCKACSVQYMLRQDASGKWNGFVRGYHDRSKPHKARPLREHVMFAANHGKAANNHGNNLHAYVTKAVGVSIPQSTLQRYCACEPDSDWQRLLRQIPAMGARITEAGLAYQQFLTPGTNILESFAFEAPTAKFCRTAAFLGIVFVDGTHMSDRLESTVLAMVTITADRVTLPVAVMFCPSEDKISCERFLNFTKNLLPKEQDYVIMSDQGSAICPAIKSVFQGTKVRHLPCFFHITQSFKDITRRELEQVLKADTKETYQELTAMFKRKRPQAYAKHEQAIRSLSFMDDEYGGVFEIIADSVIESFNSVLKRCSANEPLHVMQSVLNWGRKQALKQKKLLDSVETYCQECLKEVSRRQKQGKKLPCINGTLCDHFIVPEATCMGSEAHYELSVDKITHALTCTCKGYNRTGIPCRHMYAVNNLSLLPPISLVHRKEVINEALGSMQTILGTNLEEHAITARQIKKRPGRPRKHRFRPIKEVISSQSVYWLTCSSCGQKGHTRRSRQCPNHPKTIHRRSRSVESQRRTITPQASEPAAQAARQQIKVRRQRQRAMTKLLTND